MTAANRTAAKTLKAALARFPRVAVAPAPTPLGALGYGVAAVGLAGRRILFWHTGGTPALFAYADQLTAPLHD